MAKEIKLFNLSNPLCFFLKLSPSWWFQPIWKISSQNGNLPQIGVKIKNVWNHQPVYFKHPSRLAKSLHHQLPTWVEWMLLYIPYNGPSSWGPSFAPQAPRVLQPWRCYRFVYRNEKNTWKPQKSYLDCFFLKKKTPYIWYLYWWPVLGGRTS